MGTRLNRTTEQRHINPRLIEDIESRVHTDDLFAWIDEESEKLAELGIEESGSIEFTDALISSRHISELCVASLSTERAFIEFKDGSYVINYKKGLPSPRQRFAIAHEIGHTYWVAQNRENASLSPIQAALYSDPGIEYLCDRFAVGLLLPKKRVLESIKHFGCSIDSPVPPLDVIEPVAAQYRVDAQMVARRLFFELSPRRLAIVAVRNDVHGTLPLPGFERKDHWAIQWCALPGELQQVEHIAGLKVPFKTNGRLIPDEMIPHIATRGTFVQSLDNRWWEGVRGESVARSRKPFKARSVTSLRDAYYSASQERLIVALPL
jgi:hypothetical protein